MNSLVAAIDARSLVAGSLIVIDQISIDPMTIGGVISMSISSSTLIGSITAEAERPEENPPCLPVKCETDAVANSRADQDAGPAIAPSLLQQGGKQFLFKNLPAHNFPAVSRGQLSQTKVERALDSNPDLWMYRDRTIAILRCYMQYSLEAGRLPSVLGSEFFRTRVTSYGVTTIEDRVIFVHDVETCLGRMDDFSQQVLARIILQDYSHDEAAALLGCGRKKIHRRLSEALDILSDILLGVGLLDAIPSRDKNSCQGGQNDDFTASDCDEWK